MVDGSDLDAAERLVDDWQAGFEQRAVPARDLAGRLAVLTVRATAVTEETVGADSETGKAVLASLARLRP